MRCEHLACSCEASPQKGTCSDSCAAQSRAADSFRCECGHPICSDAIESQLHGSSAKLKR